MKDKIIPIERWAELQEERADLLAFKCQVLEGRVPARTTPPPKTIPPKAGSSTVFQLQTAIKESIAREGITAAEWCRRQHIHKRDLSMLLNHFCLQSDGKRVLSPAKIAELKSLSIREVAR